MSKKWKRKCDSVEELGASTSQTSGSSTSMSPGPSRGVVYGYLELLRPGHRDFWGNPIVIRSDPIRKPQTLIGRAANVCDVVLDDERVSTCNAMLIISEDRKAYLRNKGRENSIVLNENTLVNSREDEELKYGDIFLLAEAVPLRWIPAGVEAYKGLLKNKAIVNKEALKKKQEANKAESDKGQNETGLVNDQERVNNEGNPPGKKTDQNQNDEVEDIEGNPFNAALGPVVGGFDEFLRLDKAAKAKERLLSFVCCGEEGLMTALNLRKVGTATKHWVDNSGLQKQIFSNVQVKIQFEAIESKGEDDLGQFQVLEDFLKTPPPSQITALKLVGVELLAATDMTLKQKQVWLRFAEYWWIKLECLTVDYFDNLHCLKKSLVNQLMSAPNLQRLQVGHLKFLEPSLEDSITDFPGCLQLPQRLFQLAHISIDIMELSPSVMDQLFENLRTNLELQSLELKSVPNSLLTTVSEFIVANKKNSGLVISLTLVEATEEVTNIPLNRMYQITKSYRQLALSVAESKSTIRIRKIGMSLLEHIKNLPKMPKIKSKKFLESIEWIPSVEIYENKYTDVLLEFPNLKRVDFVKNSHEVKDIQVPGNVEHLGILCGLPSGLPGTLRHLEINETRSSLCRFLATLNSLDKSCPNLRTLIVTWKGEGNSAVEMPDFVNCEPSKDGEERFKNLRSLTFILGQPCHCNQTRRYLPSNFKGVRMALMKGLALAQLNLRHLVLGFSGMATTYPVLDKNSLNQILGGNLSKSLIQLKIGDGFVDPEASSLHQTLKERVSSNALQG